MLRLIQRSPQSHSDFEASNHSQSELSNGHFESEDTQGIDRATMPVDLAAEMWMENPNQGKFDPGTAAGIKIFQYKAK